MKKSLLSAGLVLALVASAHAQAVNWYSGTIGMTLADNSPAERSDFFILISVYLSFVALG